MRDLKKKKKKKGRSKSNTSAVHGRTYSTFGNFARRKTSCLLRFVCISQLFIPTEGKNQATNIKKTKHKQKQNKQQKKGQTPPGPALSLN